MDKPPAHAIDEQTGERLFNFRQTAKICGVDPATVRTWINGAMPFEFDFNVKRVPVTKHRGSGHRSSSEPPPRNPRKFWLLVPENRVNALKEMLEECPRRPGPLSKADIDTLEAAARRFRLSSLHKGNSL